MKLNNVILSVLPALMLAPGAQASEVSVGSAAVSTDEIIVTAQRRSQLLTDVPVSIQAMSSDDLAAKGVADLTALSMSVPGYIAATSAGFTQVFMRGVGNAVRVGADPSVATFVDDVPRIYGSMADNLVDVERIEVLKGAQGGLYGRNATGGVINIITKQPSTDGIKGSARVAYGTHDTLNASAYINLPVGDDVAFSVAAQRDRHDAYVKNLAQEAPFTADMFPVGWDDRDLSPQETADYLNETTKSRDVNTQDFWAVNVKALFKPVHNVKILLSGDYYIKDDSNGTGFQIITPEYTQSAIANNLFGRTPINVPTNFPSSLAVQPGKFEVVNGSPELLVKIREFGTSGRVDWALPNVDLSAIAAYREQLTHFKGNSANAGINDVLADVRHPDRHYSYFEVRGVSNTQGSLRLVGGATYLKAGVNSTAIDAGSATFRLTPDLPLSHTRVKQQVENWSIYGEASYDITSDLTLTTSLRYLTERNRAQFTTPVVSSASVSADKLIPAATLSYKIDGGNIYARWARGFKTGGVSVANAPSLFPRPEDGSIFKPETVDTYEIGYKQSILDRRVQLSGAVFYNDFRNMQDSARGTAAYPQINTAIINAESSRTWGVEASASVRAAEGITLSGNIGYLNAKYKVFDFTGSTVIANFDRSGKQMPKAPELQLGLSASVERYVSDTTKFVGNVSTSYTSEILWAYSPSAAVDDLSAPGYWLTNSRIGFEFDEGKYGLFLSASNLFNKGYYINGSSIAFGNSLAWGSPRIIKLELSTKF